MHRYFLALIGLSLSISATAQYTAKGRIFEDLNKNGKADKNEKGIAGVAISNGTDVALSRKDGYYELPVSNDALIFVVKPSGYSFPLDENNQPLFYYRHKPSGSPSHFKYKGASPTGPLPATLDFGLLTNPEKENFTALIFGDPQPYNLAEIEYFNKAIINETRNIRNIAFGLSLGDLVGDNLDLHLPYAKTVQQTGVPWYNVMGNHDMNYEAQADSLSDETFEKNFGPANYSFNYGKAHFIVLDDILYPDPRDGKGYWGGFRPDQLQFLRNDLQQASKDQLIVLAFHIPLLMDTDSAFRPGDRQQFFDLLKDFPHVLALSAHTHLQRHNFYDAKDGWNGQKPFPEYNAGTTSGDWYSGELNEAGVPVSTMRDGTPKGYAFLKIEGNQYKIDYKVAGKPKEYQMSVFTPKVVPHQKRTSSAIYVNFFMGAENDTVSYRVDGGNWATLQRVKNTDPSFLDQLHRWDFTEQLIPGRRPSNAEICSHLWSGPIPTDLAPGDHSIEVRAVDRFGQQFTQSSSYRIAAVNQTIVE